MAVYDPRGGGNVHFDRLLTTISIGWAASNAQAFVGAALYPPVGVTKQSDKYYVFGQEAWSLDPAGDVRAPGTVANEIPGLKVSIDSYFAQEHSLQIAITDEERDNTDAPMSPERDGTELVTSKILLGREIGFKTQVTTAANYESDHTTTLSGTAQWNDYTNSDPIANVRTWFRKIHSKIFVEPNLAIIPFEVFSQLEDHTKLIARIQYSERGILTADLIASLLGIPNVIVPGVGYNSANPGQTASVGYLWGKDVVLAYVPPRAGLRVPAFAYEFVWGYQAGMTGGGAAMATERWREEPRKSEIVRVGRRYDYKMVTLGPNSKSIAGFLAKAVVA